MSPATRLTSQAVISYEPPGGTTASRSCDHHWRARRRLVPTIVVVSMPADPGPRSRGAGQAGLRASAAGRTALPMKICIGVNDVPCGRHIANGKRCSECSRIQRANEQQRLSRSPYDRDYSSPAWQRLRRLHLELHPHCVQCGRPGPARMHVDHVVPRRLGGPDALSNLQTLCASCHSTKTAAER